MGKRKPLMPGDRVRCTPILEGRCPGHTVTVAMFYGRGPGFREYRQCVRTQPDRCGWTGGSEQHALVFVRLPRRPRA